VKARTLRRPSPLRGEPSAIKKFKLTKDSECGSRNGIGAGREMAELKAMNEALNMFCQSFVLQASRNDRSRIEELGAEAGSHRSSRACSTRMSKRHSDNFILSVKRRRTGMKLRDDALERSPRSENYAFVVIITFRMSCTHVQVASLKLDAMFNCVSSL